MNMRYRGLSYQSNHQVIETAETGLAAKFRGVVYQVLHPISTTIPNSVITIKYRGIPYILGK